MQLTSAGRIWNIGDCMLCQRHPDHSIKSFLKRTVAAQMHLIGCLVAVTGLFILLRSAGTYTPVILNVISPPWSRFLLVLIWSIGVGGIAYSFFRMKLPHWARHRYANTAIYVLMGWVLVLRIGEALNHLTPKQAVFLIAGGGIRPR